MRAPTRKRLAAFAAIAIGAGGVVGLAALPAQAQELAKYPIVDGSVAWGVKESFRNYVTGPIAGGAIEAVDGATVNDDGTFTFAPVTGVSDLPNQATETAAPGGVHFTGHHGDLDLLIENIETVSDTESYTGAIYADVTSGGEVFEDVHFADFTVGAWTYVDGFTTLTDAPVVLTADGAEAFAGFYQAGTALDPITIAVKTDMTDPIGEEPTEEEPSSEDPASEGPSSEEPGGTVYDVTGGDADWGVKESFRSYVTGPIANGEITVAEPATENADGTYHFPEAAGTFTAETCHLDASFAGAVNFYGHEGELDLDLADLSVKSVDGGLAVFSGATQIADVAVEQLAITGGAVTVDVAAATVAAGGVDFFGGFYTEGTELDPVSFTVQIDGAPDTSCEPTGTPGGGTGGEGTTTSASGAGSPKLPVTGSPLTLFIAAAGVLLAGGAAVMVLARRRALQA
ncbi:MAG: HtaA domain-containing protein [Glycomyces artemisiae]|uniref:HtaA domain-containing protein n=1 Tax=Glycomyces artemisiae TaxID=1076443 RepID=A0A850C3L7_9ACTN|nr:HtaA domain-containing protein [Glycomyces artemisiae]